MKAQDYERESIRQYVELEASDEHVTHLEPVATRDMLNEHYEIWDVWTDQNRWWVISPMTNLYLQADFQSMDMAFVYHLGIVQTLMARRERPQESEKERALNAWRKWEQAADELARGQEPEDYQAVGMRLREGLIAFVQALAKDEYVPSGEERPQASNVIRWTELIAESLAPGPAMYNVRVHLKETARTTWQLVQWLTHAANATLSEAEIASGACGHLAASFLTMEVKREKGPPQRCPRCSSYRVKSCWRVEHEDYILVCESCDWQDLEGRPAPT